MVGDEALAERVERGKEDNPDGRSEARRARGTGDSSSDTRTMPAEGESCGGGEGLGVEECSTESNTRCHHGR